ncbi:hypothetical protein AYO44_00165 [Planctomycetaceae bacterium SCGC AG-212-F19]|nr:hypothetical protein AYO44_00165 [Planctomycetaceae bacterium SCGC AG-212-F19]
MLSDNVYRRDFLKLAAAGALGASQSMWFDVLASRAASAAKDGVKTKSAILLWMAGGPAQSHTWDVKDGNSYSQIATAASGVKISEHLPSVAKEMKDMAIIRSMSTGDGNHQSGNYLMHTGFRIGSGGGLVHPSLGAMVAYKLGKDEDELPNFVSVGGTRGPGHLGPKYAPLQVSANSKGLPDIRAAGSQSEVDANASLITELNDSFLKDYQAPAINAQKTTLQRAVALMKSNKTKAFNTDEEPASARDAYGKSGFGAGCLLARRLIEGGVKFVEVSLGGWDTHQDADGKVKNLSGSLDPAFAQLMKDLRERGLLDSTLIIWMGEFGRGPGNGSNHYARCWSSVLAGGGIKGGQVIGNSGAKGANPEDHPVAAGDFFATICKIVGIDYTKSWITRGSRPMDMVAKGAKPVNQLI